MTSQKDDHTFQEVRIAPNYVCYPAVIINSTFFLAKTKFQFGLHIMVLILPVRYIPLD